MSYVHSKQGSHSNVRIKILDFFITFQDLRCQKSGRILVLFWPQTMALIAEQDTVNVMAKISPVRGLTVDF